MSLWERPQVTVIAGPNGSGKSTLTDVLLPSARIPILDPDAIAREMSPEAPEQARLAAGRLVLQRQSEYIAEGTSFAVESQHGYFSSGGSSLSLMSPLKSVDLRLFKHGEGQLLAVLLRRLSVCKETTDR